MRLLSLIFTTVWVCNCNAEAGIKTVPGGSLAPFLKSKSGTTKLVHVGPFKMDMFPVTQKQFLDFVTRHSEWRKSKVKALFADVHYLQPWPSDLDFGAQNSNGPANFVSWYAASAFCHSVGKKLASTDQWEFAARDLNRKKSQTTQSILDWYSEPSVERLPKVGSKEANGFGLYDLFGLTWEWTDDFGDDQGGTDGKFVCGGAGQAAADPTDYATYMRYSFRASLKAKYALGSLGFRCIQEIL